jgi:uncharacterized protein YmfQ (DUF2313 family)
MINPRHYPVLKRLFPVSNLGDDFNYELASEARALDSAEDVLSTLIAEIFPLTATDNLVHGCINDWEAVFNVSLRDRTLSQRRGLVAVFEYIASINMLLGDVFYFIATSLGYGLYPAVPYVLIQTGLHLPFRAGYSSAGDTVFDGSFRWSMFDVWILGHGVVGNHDLQAFYNRLMPVWCNIIYADVAD